MKTRKEYLLKVALEYLKAIDNSEHADALGIILKYDNADCDGQCLIEDIGLALDLEETTKTTKDKTQEKIKALCELRNIGSAFVEYNKDQNVFEIAEDDDVRVFRIYDEAEANDAVNDEILNSLWMINPLFIKAHTFGKIKKETIAKLQKKLLNEANGFIRAIINDIDVFIDDYISSEGQGSILATKDGVENEQDGFYIYRIY